MRRADRLFRLVLLLGGGRVLTARALAAELEVCERTIYRDVADLVASGVPVDGAAGVGYRLRRGYQVPPLMFTPEELEALLLGAQVVRSWADAGLGAAAERALAKVEAALPVALRPQLTRSALIVPDFHVPEQARIALGELRRAIGATCKLRLDYRRADGEASRRTVRPLGLFYWGRVWTLAAWCELRGSYRTFRVDRITALEALAERFDAGDGAELRRYLAAVACAEHGD
ncbi:helix-turn-helix transcriptional regulator [Plasticicumulans acidivorans]|uniref:HTH domain-containing protein n=1 Tax=Plasticicumulans acidivorans TaxID=886464 RepID=A0A317MRM6_9GAMM|nr:YafY family protein [Plasticicumulans acidivorans]PWV59531.1 HTH domain-containing protein [Plasticicumulans acidivorans]